MATRYTTLKNFILTKLQGVSKLSSDNIFDEPRTDFTGYPAAIFYPVQGDVNYQTTAADKRTYSFEILIYYDTERFGVSKALDSLFEAIDDVMDVFSTDRNFSTIVMPAGDVFLQCRPVRAGWRQTADQKLVVGVVKIDCEVSVQSAG